MYSKQFGLITNLINQAYQSPENSTSLLMNSFQLYNKELSGISIFKFDEQNSNFTSFDEFKHGKYNLCRLGDYNKTWKIDARPNLVKNLCVKKEVYLDQNILINLYQYSLGHSIRDQENFIKFMNTLKDYNYDIRIECAFIEALIANPNHNEYYKNVLKVFHQYLSSSMLNSNIKNIILSDKKLRELEREFLNLEEFINDKDLANQLNAFKCQILNAFILKYDKKRSRESRIDDFILFCLNDLSMFNITSIYALIQFLNDTDKNYFSKLQVSQGKKLDKVINNIAWDMFHPYLAEELELLKINENDEIPLIYFATADKDLSKYISLNPLKMIVYQEGHIPYNVPTYNFESIINFIKSNALIRKIQDEEIARKEKIASIDFLKIYKELLKNANQVIAQYN